MQLLVIFVVSLLLFLAGTTRNAQLAVDAPQAALDARAQIDKYRTFMYVANLYMQGYSGGAATLTWSTLKTASGAPSGAVNAGMPASWKVVASADNSWVACTDVDERALGAVQQMAVAGGVNVFPGDVSGKNYFVVGTAADSGKASLCD